MKKPLEYCALHIKGIIYKNHLIVDVHIALNVIIDRMLYQYLYDNDEKVNNDCCADNLFTIFLFILSALCSPRCWKSWK